MRTPAILPVLLLLVSACSQEPLNPSTITNPGWEIQYSDSTALFIGLHAVSRDIVWASGSGGRVVRTLDGGNSWTAMVVPGADTLQFRDIHAFDGDQAFVLSIGSGSASRIYRTRDGGNTWDLSYEGNRKGDFFDCISFWNPQRGIAFSDSNDGEFTIITTLDGGTSWQRVPTDALPDARPNEGAFASSGTCVVTRPGGKVWFSTGASAVDTRVFRSGDYGVSWKAVLTPIPSNSSTSGIFSLSFADDRTGIAVGGDFSLTDSVLTNVAVTVDGGDTWRIPGTSNLKGSIFGASYIPGAPSLSIVAVAPTGTDLSVDNGGNWMRIDSSSFWSVSFAGPDAGWAAGPGSIARFTFDRELR